MILTSTNAIFSDYFSFPARFCLRPQITKNQFQIYICQLTQNTNQKMIPWVSRTTIRHTIMVCSGKCSSKVENGELCSTEWVCNNPFVIASVIIFSSVTVTAMLGEYTSNPHASKLLAHVSTFANACLLYLFLSSELLDFTVLKTTVSPKYFLLLATNRLASNLFYGSLWTLHPLPCSALKNVTNKNLLDIFGTVKKT